MIIFALFSYLASPASYSIPISIPSKSKIDIILPEMGKEVRFSIFPKPQGHKFLGEESILVTLNSPRKGNMLLLSARASRAPAGLFFPSCWGICGTWLTGSLSRGWSEKAGRGEVVSRQLTSVSAGWDFNIHPKCSHPGLSRLPSWALHGCFLPVRVEHFQEI